LEAQSGHSLPERILLKTFSEAKAILGLENEPKKMIHHENIEGKEIDYLIVEGIKSCL